MNDERYTFFGDRAEMRGDVARGGPEFPAFNNPMAEMPAFRGGPWGYISHVPRPTLPDMFQNQVAKHRENDK